LRKKENANILTFREITFLPLPQAQLQPNTFSPLFLLWFLPCVLHHRSKLEGLLLGTGRPKPPLLQAEQTHFLQLLSTGQVLQPLIILMALC